MQTPSATAEISTMGTLARQNDAFRQALMTINFEGQMLRGRVGMSTEVANLDHEDLLGVLKKVREFDDFAAGDDPYGEHDFLAFSHPIGGEEQRFIFKIDYYSDPAMEFGSEDPVDPSVTYRTGTLLLASEY